MYLCLNNVFEQCAYEATSESDEMSWKHELDGYLVSSWIFHVSCQLRRVTSGWITQSELFYISHKGVSYLAFTRMPGGQVRVTVGDSGLFCCVCVTSLKRYLTPMCVDSARALWASFCSRFFFYTSSKHRSLSLLESQFWIQRNQQQA